MVNKNIIEEIKELIQYIKNEYQEGVDFTIPFWNKREGSELGAGSIEITSPNLKKYFREKFNIPLEGVRYLDYHKKYPDINNCYFYRVEDGDDILYWQEDGVKD